LLVHRESVSVTQILAVSVEQRGVEVSVIVLLSTWNGEQFLRAQLASILAQLPTGGRIVVRDDGSCDGTVEEIESLEDTRVTTLRGTNIGFVQSFFELMQRVPGDAEFVFFSDQDDVWLPDKISRAVNLLSSVQGPGLYCSRLKLVDDKLRPIGVSSTLKRQASFENALVENVATGCTCALNRAALELVRNGGDLRRVMFHDWWMYLVVSAYGTVLFDDNASILYRQHGANVVGMGAGWRRYVTILKFALRKNWVHMMYDQISNFRAVHYSQLPPEKKALLDAYFDPTRRTTALRLVLSSRRFRQTFLLELMMRLLILASLLGRAELTSTLPPAKYDLLR
jgi:glycosyltransferase involved in cell wall biosynthesis